MKMSDIIKKAMKARGFTQEQLRDVLGVSNQNVISARINSDNPKIGTVVEILDALGYEMVIRPKRNPEERDVVTL